MKTRIRKTRALTMIEVLIVVAVLMLLAVFYFSIASNRPHTTSRKRWLPCTSSLRQIGIAFQIWAQDHNGKFPMQVSVTNGGSMEFVGGPETFRHFRVMSNDLNTPKILLCSSEVDSWRKRATVFDGPSTEPGWLPFASNTNLSYFVGIDAMDLHPQMLLAGDHNITNGTVIRSSWLEVTTNRSTGWTSKMHVNLGNVVLVDGSVQSVNTAGLRDLIKLTRVATNRLAMP